ncbi:MetQ/NlpA family ABC transporter substrate-binding protein [Acinetobacter larvae]|uniref:Methionine transporter n=1 Tax=Acinetobacter larvae TaxID=1789224 RepID=A0A1B2LYC6_9GAMM|nr:MetQ/NlpA family ABC transporter substrate-binding protein [Acinetobacter larvae]AOA57941.1 methionine transporter [Acinetobacter larvae]
MSKTQNTQHTRRNWLIGLGLVALVIAAVVWNNSRGQQQPLKIAISPSFASSLQVAVNEAKKQGLNVELIEFSDWNTPNIALNNGDIDANFFQHQPFLNNAIQKSDYKLKPFAVGAASHVGLYSKKYKSLAELPTQARVVIPNDPVNQGRALLLLQQAQLITLQQPGNHLSNLQQIASNPKQLKFIEVEGPQTARALDDADLAFGYPHYLRLAKTADPNDALLLDDNKSALYAILFVVRDDYVDQDDRLAKFVEIYQNSPEVKTALDQEFGAKLWFPAWKLPAQKAI